MITFSGESALHASQIEAHTADQQLASEVARHDPGSLQEFLLKFRPTVFRYLWHSSGSREDAEDLTSQALLAAARDIKHYRQEGPLQAWVFRVAQHELLRYRRRQELAKVFLKRKPNTSPPSEPDDFVVVSEALAKLPMNQRTAFLLTEVEGFSVEEAAQVIGIPAGTVKSRCFHAKQRLRALLASTYQENQK